MALLNEPIIAVTLGDPSGIGPEVTLRALADAEATRGARLVLVGSDDALRRISGSFGLGSVEWRVVSEQDLRSFPPIPIPLVDIPGAYADLAAAGEPTAESGRCAAAAIEKAVELALGGLIDAIVTAPISKVALKMAGYDWPGHTEMIAHLCGVEKPVMMMVGAGMRVALVTTHVAIRELPDHITQANVLATLLITARDLRARFGVADPLIAVTGLNPHAGDGGRFGIEEQTDIIPAMEVARREGVRCEGPFPADVIFTPAKRERYDAIVAMAHDQANIPVKALAFDSGVNVTLGLPLIRTSPDHGTAYDIAARAVADPGSMKAAIAMARDMALAERPLS